MSKEGSLFYAESSNRYVALFRGGTYHELHCGDCLSIRIEGVWVHVRIEYDWDNRKWYFVDCTHPVHEGLAVKM